MKTQTSKTKTFLAGAALVALIATPLARADYPATVLSQSPLGYWQLNGTTQPQALVQATNSGSLGNGANGTYNGFPSRGLTGPFTGSKALSLDGGSQSVTLPYQSGVNPTSFSFEAWVNPAAVGNFAYVGSSVHIGTPRSGWYMAQDNGGTFLLGNAFVVRMFYQNGNTPAITLSATNDLPNGSWYHLVLTCNGTTASLYKNGVLASSGTLAGWVPNVDSQLSLGMRSDAAFNWPGKMTEVAVYNTALTAGQVANHYNTATTTPANYGSTVLADAPAVFYRFQEPADPPVANSGTLGSAGDGFVVYDAKPGTAGAVSPTFPGMIAGNKAVSFDGGGGVVRLPALNLNTNAVTISAWINVTNPQPTAAGIVECKADTTEAGLTIDQVYGGYGLGYVWNGNTYGISPSSDLGLPPLQDSTWCYAALVIRPASAEIYICDANNFGNWASVTNTFGVSHPNQAFDGPTLMGSVAGFTTRNLNGAVDEVTIFNRSVGPGELYSQYATAIGGVQPRIFGDLQGPGAPVAAGDPLTLSIDAGGSAPLTFTWHKNGGTIATTSVGTYTIASAALSDSGNYDVTISGVGSPAQSQVVPVTVVTPTLPAISSSSGFANRTIYPGGSLILSVNASGGGLKYRWYKNSTLIPSATASTFSIASVVTTDAGNYSVSVTNSLGTASNGPAAITITNSPGGSYESLVVGSAPEAWWRLDESSGTNLFDGMGRHNGFYTNQNNSSPPVTFGAAGALSADSDTAVTFLPSYGGFGVIPFSPALNPIKFSVEAWVKTSQTSGNFAAASSSYSPDGWWMQPNGGYWWGDSFNGTFGNNGNVMGQIVPGQWSHIVVEYDATRVSGTTHYPYTLYVNGVTDGFIWGGSANASGPFVIGARGNTAGTPFDRLFDGQVDEVAVYGRLLPVSEITSHFNGRFGSTTAPYFVGSFLPQTVTAGKSLSYGTTVYGSVPITLQWYKGASKITGATTASLALNNLQVSDSATYTLWATNGAGTSSQSVNVSVLPPASYANATNGLVVHLRFEGDVTDTSGRGNNGTAVGSPPFVPGIIGAQALQPATATNGAGNFASASYVNLGRPADLQFTPSQSFSVGLWVKMITNDSPGDVPFIGNEVNSANNPGWVLCPSYHAGGWQWDLNDNVNNIDLSGPNNSMNDGLWHNFVLTVDRANARANSYLDGVLQAQSDITGLGTVDNGSPIFIGQDPTGTYPEGATNSLDDIGIWTRALSAAEVANIESAGRTAGRSFDTQAPSVTMTIARSGANLVISYTSGTLLQSDSVGPSAVWTPVTGASPPSYTFTPTGSNKYYRVQLQ